MGWTVMSVGRVCVERTQTVLIPKARTTVSVTKDSNSPRNCPENLAVLTWTSALCYLMCVERTLDVRTTWDLSDVSVMMGTSSEMVSVKTKTSARRAHAQQMRIA